MNRITAFADPAQDQSLIDQPEHDARLDRAKKITARILTRTYGGKQ